MLLLSSVALVTASVDECVFNITGSSCKIAWEIMNRFYGGYGVTKICEANTPMAGNYAKVYHAITCCIASENSLCMRQMNLPRLLWTPSVFKAGSAPISRDEIDILRSQADIRGNNYRRNFHSCRRF
jgi:hypothetical protein